MECGSSGGGGWVVVRSPVHRDHVYRVQFAEGFEAPFHHDQLVRLVDFKSSQVRDNAGIYDGLEIDLVTHDAKKFFTLMLRRNSEVLEQLLSPLMVYATPEFKELKSLAAGCVNKHHAHHYLGFAATQWRLFSKEKPPRVKPLLYVYRVLLSEIHLMQTGFVEASLVKLNEQTILSYINDLIAQKLSGPEQGTLTAADLSFNESEYQRLTRELEDAYKGSILPELPSARADLNNMVVRLGLKAD